MKTKYLPVLALLILTACTPPASDPAPSGTPTDSDQMEMDDDHDMGMMDDMMMETSALKEGCSALSAKSAREKALIIDEIGHNMDHDALDMILGEDCAFLGDVVEVAEITDNNLKLNPNDTETLYFSPDTNRFFVTCKSMNTFAYVVPRSNDQDPAEYFAEHHSEFAGAADMAKNMMEDMGDMEMGGGEDEEEEKMRGGSYVENSFTDASVANAVIGNGEPALLFFYASWCGYCQAKDVTFKELYRDESFSVSTYKIDFDTANDLKAHFGVSTQDTVVLVDGSGEADQVILGATKNDLITLLSK